MRDPRSSRLCQAHRFPFARSPTRQHDGVDFQDGAGELERFDAKIAAARQAYAEAADVLNPIFIGLGAAMKAAAARLEAAGAAGRDASAERARVEALVAKATRLNEVIVSTGRTFPTSVAAPVLLESLKITGRRHRAPGRASQLDLLPWRPNRREVPEALERAARA